MGRVSKGKAKMLVVWTTRTKWQQSLQRGTKRVNKFVERTVSIVLNKQVELGFPVTDPSVDFLWPLLCRRGTCKSPQLTQQLVPRTCSTWESNFPKQGHGQTGKSSLGNPGSCSPVVSFLLCFPSHASVVGHFYISRVKKTNLFVL